MDDAGRAGSAGGMCGQAPEDYRGLAGIEFAPVQLGCAMAYRKAELAEIQLDMAVRLFLDADAFVCAATLAGAAEELFGSLLARAGQPNALDELYASWRDANLPELTQKAFRDSLNHVRNQLKHAGDPQYDEIEVRQADAMILIARAAGMHRHFADAPTPDLVRFHDWWVANAEKLINDLPLLDQPAGTV